MPLTALKVRHAGPGRHADIQGLYLVVRDTGTRSWMLRIQRHGRRRDFGLGSADDVSLADARLAVADYRRMLRNGPDPVKELGLRRKAAPTFEKVARDCFDAMKCRSASKRPPRRVRAKRLKLRSKRKDKGVPIDADRNLGEIADFGASPKGYAAYWQGPASAPIYTRDAEKLPLMRT